MDITTAYKQHKSLRITIPANVRRALRIRAGYHLRWYIYADGHARIYVGERGDAPSDPTTAAA